MFIEVVLTIGLAGVLYY